MVLSTKVNLPIIVSLEKVTINGPMPALIKGKLKMDYAMELVNTRSTMQHIKENGLKEKKKVKAR